MDHKKIMESYKARRQRVAALYENGWTMTRIARLEKVTIQRIGQMVRMAKQERDPEKVRTSEDHPAAPAPDEIDPVCKESLPTPPVGYLDRQGNLWTIEEFERMPNDDRRKGRLKPLVVASGRAANHVAEPETEGVRRKQAEPVARVKRMLNPKSGN